LPSTAATPRRPRRPAGLPRGHRPARRRRTHCRRGIRSTIPRRRDERRARPFDRALSRLRHRVENLVNRAKQYRSLATRYDKRAESYRALWTIAMTILWPARLAFAYRP
jgi:transposase